MSKKRKYQEYVDSLSKPVNNIKIPMYQSKRRHPNNGITHVKNPKKRTLLEKQVKNEFCPMEGESGEKELLYSGAGCYA